MNGVRLTVALAAAALLPLGSAAEEPAAPPPVVEIDRAGLPQPVTDVEGVERKLHRDGRVFVAGQPSEAALAKLTSLGVTVVVNLRTPKEMADREQVPFDEAAAVERLGLEYVHIPLGGQDYPYTPEAVDRFAAVLAKQRGPVLLHCTVAWRASHMWTAYLIRHAGLDFDAALARGRAIALTPEPLEGLLGRRLRVTLGEALPPAAARP